MLEDIAETVGNKDKLQESKDLVVEITEEESICFQVTQRENNEVYLKILL